jgi:mycofactocin precursor peptide peptidase
MSEAWMTTADVGDRRPIVIVPVGSWEQHGAHLPFDTDTVIAVELVRRAIERLADVTLLPVAPIAFGNSGEHRDFPGTISIGGKVTTDVLVEIARSCDWADGVVFVNGHGGNTEAIRDALEIIRSEGRHALAWSPTTSDPGDSHAGHAETSVMLALAPSRVRMDRAEKGVTEPLVRILDAMRESGVRAVSPNGVLGDPAGAKAEHGHSLLEEWTESLSHSIKRWHRDRP